MKGIRFENVTKKYKSDAKPAVNDVSLEVEDESFVVLLGPSGCGKTTLLKMVNRLLEPESGKIYWNDVDIQKVEVTELRKKIGYVIQQVGLFPHMTIEQNIAVVPNLLHWSKSDTDVKIDEMLDLVHLPKSFRSRYPSQLSGGQQQRVGLARALAADPEVILMDEPFGAIDAITRASLQNEVKELKNRLRKTILFVTHDVDEALKLADKIVVMKDGKLVQYAVPCELLISPENQFVRELVNSDDRIRQISLFKVQNVMGTLPEGFTMRGDEATISFGEDSRKAISMLLYPGVHSLVVMNENVPAGVLTLELLRNTGCLDTQL